MIKKFISQSKLMRIAALSYAPTFREQIGREKHYRVSMKERVAYVLCSRRKLSIFPPQMREELHKGDFYAF